MWMSMSAIQSSLLDGKDRVKKPWRVWRASADVLVVTYTIAPPNYNLNRPIDLTAPIRFSGRSRQYRLDPDCFQDRDCLQERISTHAVDDNPPLHRLRGHRLCQRLPGRLHLRICR